MPGQSTSMMKYVVRLNLKGAAFPRYAKTVHGVTHHVRALGQKQFAKVPLIATIKNRVTGKVASLMKTYHGGKQKYLAYTHVGTKRDTYHKTLKAGARSAVMKTGTIRVKSHMARKMGHGYRVKAHTRKRSRR